MKQEIAFAAPAAAASISKPALVADAGGNCNSRGVITRTVADDAAAAADTETPVKANQTLTLSIRAFPRPVVAGLSTGQNRVIANSTW